MRKAICFLIGLSFFSCAFEEPHFMTVNIYNCNRFDIDGNFSDLSSNELQVLINQKTKDLDSIQRLNFYIKLNIAPDATMGQVSFVQRELRKSNVLNVRFYEIENINCGF